MRYTQVIFSPTGGTQKVADAVTEEWGNNIDRVDLSDAVSGICKKSEWSDGLRSGACNKKSLF